MTQKTVNMPKTDQQKKFFTRDHFRIELLVVALAVYCSVFLNGTLWDILLDTQRGLWPTQRWTFFWVTTIGITAFQVGFLSLFVWGRFAKMAVAILALITVITHYFSNQYRVMFDTSMIRNVLATNLQESSDLITFKAIGLSLLYLLPVALALGFYGIPSISFGRQISAKLMTVVVALGVSVIAAGSQYKSLSSAIRNHGEIRHLVLPTSPILAFARMVGTDTAQASINKEPLDVAPQRLTQTTKKPLLTVVVVGETVRAQNWGLSGSEHQTTPQLAQISKQELFNFPYAKSCGTNTETSVPCMFSGIGRSDYSEKWIKQHESVLALMQRAGVDMSWIDNQSGCKGACDGIKSMSASELVRQKKAADDLLDDILIKGLTASVSKIPKDQVVVLHMLGNHGPAYHKRYPQDKAYFTPTCQDNNLTNCSREAIINTYDNAIRYTDDVLAKLIQHLNQLQDRSVSLIYVSDHGESLGEKGLYLHGVPYAFAPEEQTRVPFFFWFPERTQKMLRLNGECLRRKVSRLTEHDLLAHSLLGLYKISSPVYKKQWDFIQDCHA
jgi:lipid A ethanolaminephosphotransferase